MLTSEDAPNDAESLPRAAELHGVVDNVGADKLYGWAWNLSQPAERVAVELRLADVAVHRTVADFARPDLPKAGIGDGNHAFEVKLTPDWINRRSELSVVAIAADGTTQALPIRVRRSAEVTAAATQRAVDGLVAAQRQLREDLRALATRLPEAGEAALGQRLAETQRQLDDRLGTLEVWLTRLDARLAGLPAAVAPPPVRRLDAWQVVLAATLALSACAAIGAAWLLHGQ